jgi:hypothetical protein
LILCCFFKESLAVIRPGKFKFNCPQLPVSNINISLFQAKPVIKSAQQISENAIMLEWKDGSLQQDFNEPNLKRYRVFFRNDNSDNLYSWPGFAQFN